MLNRTPNRRGRHSVKTSVLHSMIVTHLNTVILYVIMQHIKQSTVNYIYVHNTDVDGKIYKR